MSVNTKRRTMTCIVCQHGRASTFDLFCPDCGAELIPAQPRQRCQSHNALGEPCGNYAYGGRKLCESCERLYAGEARNGTH